jgi:hypothetical protein
VFKNAKKVAYVTKFTYKYEISQWLGISALAGRCILEKL